MSEPVHIKRGAVVVPIYHTPGPRGDGWTLVYREPDGARRRLFRATLDAAKKEGEIVATRLANVPDTLAGPEAREAVQARQLAEAAGITLLAAVQGFCDVLKRQQAAAAQPQVPLSEVCEKFLRKQKEDGISQPYLEELKGRLTPFCEALCCPASSLSASLIDTWLRTTQKARGWSNRSRNHCRAAISNLLSFAKREGYLAREWAEMAYVPKAQEEDKEIGVYTPEELRRILAKRPGPDLLPFVVLGAFTGARPSEIQRLDWRDFHWETGELFIGKGKVRTAGHRLVPLLPACVAWLQSIRKTSGPVTRLKFFSKPLVDLVRSANVVSIRDGLRHSYITYRRAVTKNLAQVSGEAGTDPGTLTRRYCRPVRQADAEAWFALRP